MSKKRTAKKAPHRTQPLAETITHVKGYPRKLTLYKCEASRYWQVRYYADGKVLRRSTRKESKREAIEYAKRFYDEINLKRASGVALVSRTAFSQCAEHVLEAMRGKLARGQLTKDTVDIAEYRLRRSALPFFGNTDINDIHYEHLEQYLSHLSAQQPALSISTIGAYMRLVKRVFSDAYKRRLLTQMPHMPTVGTEDNARGYFSTREYRRLHSRARALVGKRFQYRVLKDEDGNELIGDYYEHGTQSEGRLIRTVTITRELAEMTVFMPNTYIRPTDLKNLKHKHIEIVRDEYTYLRLNPPRSKKHDGTIVSMAWAVVVYERLTELNKQNGLGTDADDYLFFPQHENRGYALKLLQQQFDVLLRQLGLEQDAKGNRRSIYSLRHTGIMFRLMYGEKMDYVTLARNARTSAEMIDRFYASQLESEQNIDLIQSRRRRTRPKRT